MKRILFFVICLPFVARSQDGSLVLEGVSPNLYLNHTVASKENYYSIGRLYNVGPKTIAPYNKMQMDKGLNPGQVLKIPVGESNLSPNGKAAAGEVLVPLYYSVKEKEGLYRIGFNHNKVSVETLKKWNDLKSLTVETGTMLVVGYLKVKKNESALAAKAVVKGAEKKLTAEIKPAPKKKQQNISVDSTVTAVKDQPSKKEEKKEEMISLDTVKKFSPVNPDEKEPVKPVHIAGTDFQGGVFKSLYESQTRSDELGTETGLGGVFKSTSGWNDGKYYCLHNTAKTGSIIKVTNTTNGKSVYAKVLDVIPDIKKNSILLIRLSNAAADELGVGEANFNCTLNYSK